MKTAIIHTSKHGTTAQVAKMLAAMIPGSLPISLEDRDAPSLRSFDMIILGTPIYAGRPRSKMVRFYNRNMAVLTEKKVGLFICCMWPEEEARFRQLNDAFPQWLHASAAVEAVLGGEFDFGKMTLMERIIIRRVAKVPHSVSAIDLAAIERFAATVIGIQQIPNELLT